MPTFMTRAQHCDSDGVLATYVQGDLQNEDFLTEGHDVPAGTDAEQYEGFELHEISIPTLPLVAAGESQVEIEFALQLPSKDPAAYDRFGCMGAAGLPWQTLGAGPTRRSIYGICRLRSAAMC